LLVKRRFQRRRTTKTLAMRLDLFDCIRTGQFGRLRVGARLRDFGRLYGVPRYWGFNEVSSSFHCYMGYRHVEVYAAMKEGDIAVTGLKMDLLRIRGRVAIIKGLRGFECDEIILPSAVDRTLEAIKSSLSSRDIRFATEVDWPVKDETTGVIACESGVNLYFGLSNRLEVIEA
jgi:hypothetical protein